MCLNQITCPNCRAALNSKAGVEVGTSIVCPKCKQKFAVVEPKREKVANDFDFVNDEDDAATKRPSSPSAKSRRAVNDGDEAPRKTAGSSATKKNEDDDDRDEAPRRKPVAVSAKKRADDDEERNRRSKNRRGEVEDDDRPSAKRCQRPEDRDDEDDRPSGKKKKLRKDGKDVSVYGQLKRDVWFRVGLLGTLLLVLCWLGSMLMQKHADENSSGTDSRSQRETSPYFAGPVRPTTSNRQPVDADPEKQLLGKWRFKGKTDLGQVDISLEYRGDNTFTQVIVRGPNRSEIKGRWRVVNKSASSLMIERVAKEVEPTSIVMFSSADTMNYDVPVPEGLLSCSFARE